MLFLQQRNLLDSHSSMWNFQTCTVVTTVQKEWFPKSKMPGVFLCFHRHVVSIHLGHFCLTHIPKHMGSAYISQENSADTVLFVVFLMAVMSFQPHTESEQRCPLRYHNSYCSICVILLFLSPVMLPTFCKFFVSSSLFVALFCVTLNFKWCFQYF